MVHQTLSRRRDGLARRAEALDKGVIVAGMAELAGHGADADVIAAENGVIGDKNALLWHISEDLKYFKSVTSGHPVVMGRKTYESLGRPLPNRTNVVVTRQEMEIPGCRVAHSLEEAVALFPAEEEVFVIGGAQIYAQALPLAGRFYLTRVFHAYEGDTHFPAWNDAEWRLVSSESFASGANYPYPFAFETYERRRN